jgi:hypothetical protein
LNLFEASLASELHPASPMPIEQNSRCMGVDENLEIRSAHCRMQISRRRAATHPIPLGALVDPDAGLGCAIEI